MMNIYMEPYDETNQWVGISSPLFGYPRTLPSRPRAAPHSAGTLRYYPEVFDGCVQCQDRLSSDNLS